MEGEEDSNCNSRLHSRYSLVRLRVEVAVAASLIGLMHDKSWLWLGLTVHQMVMVSTGEGRGKGERRGVACRSCDDSISISTPTPLAPHWQAKHLVTHRCRVQRGTWNYLATLCSSKLLPLPLLHIACHTYCVSSRYNYAYSMYLLRLLWLPSRLLDRTLSKHLLMLLLLLMLPQVFASPFVDNFWQAINTHRSYAACTKQIKFVNIESG